MDKPNHPPAYVPPGTWSHGASPLTPEERTSLLASIDRQIAEIDARRSSEAESLVVGDGPIHPLAADSSDSRRAAEMSERS